MILVFCSTKGGVGKSNLAYHVSTALLDNFRLIEIDDNNQTASIFNNSPVLQNNVINVTTQKGDDAFCDALFELTQKKLDIIIDAGGGNDSKQVIELVKSQTSYDESVFVIPFMSGREQVQNAIATYELVKTRKVLFVLNAGRTPQEFIFWYGDENEGIPSVPENLLNVPTVFIPWTQLFDRAAMSGETIKDVASFANVFHSSQEARSKIAKIADKDKAEFKRLFNRYRLANEVQEFIKADLSDFAFAIQGLAK